MAELAMHAHTHTQTNIGGTKTCAASQLRRPDTVVQERSVLLPHLPRCANWEVCVSGHAPPFNPLANNVITRGLKKGKNPAHLCWLLGSMLPEAFLMQLNGGALPRGIPCLLVEVIDFPVNPLLLCPTRWQGKQLLLQLHWRRLCLLRSNI